LERSAVLQSLKVPVSTPLPQWDEAAARRPSGLPPFLAPEFVARSCGAAGLPDAMARAVAAAAARIAGDEALSAFAWYCADQLFDIAPPAVDSWPDLNDALGEDAGLFYVVVLLAGTPKMLAVHRERGISETIARDTTHDLERCMATEDYFQLRGRWGISPRILGWLRGHWLGEVYHLTRLQFAHGVFEGNARAFRSRRDRTVVVLSENGLRYRTDGSLAGKNAAADGWTSALHIDDAGVDGFPIHPRGHAVNKSMRLEASEWAPALAPGDPVLHIHIPAGPPPLSHALCGQSIREALAFFPRHFPDRPFKALVCQSWFLDPQFERILPASSNIVRFQQEFYLLPTAWNDSSALYPVFGHGTQDVRGLARKTAMQKAVAKHIEDGGHFRGGGCVLFPEDFDWGGCHYRNQKFFLGRTWT
jgi:hypothetical protein